MRSSVRRWRRMGVADAIRYIGIARMGDKIVMGEENSRSLIKSGKARLLVVASDTSDGAKRRAEGYVFETDVPMITVPYTKAEISAISGKPGCSMAAFRDLGLAESFVRALDAQQGGSYGPLVEELARRRERVSVRKTGKRRKNV